jgi:hypothetical protein
MRKRNYLLCILCLATAMTAFAQGNSVAKENPYIVLEDANFSVKAPSSDSTDKNADSTKPDSKIALFDSTKAADNIFGSESNASKKLKVVWAGGKKPEQPNVTPVTPKEVKSKKMATDNTANTNIKPTTNPPAPNKNVILANNRTTTTPARTANLNVPGKGKKSKKSSSNEQGEGVTTGRVTIYPASKLNGSYDDFSPAAYQNGIVFVSNSKKFGGNTKASKSEEAGDFNLRFSEIDSTGALTRPASFGHLNSSKTHEGPVTFSQDGKTMYMTRNAAFDDGKKRGKKAPLNLKIFAKTLIGEEWTGDEIFPFETEFYSFGHPTLSADGKRLYFSSNMPGGFGGMDIYVTRKMADGQWSQPINMGSRVNTPGNEVFPYIAENDALYFSSNARRGAQGLDIFRIDILTRTALSQKLEAPFNSEGDDFGIMFLPGSNNRGFFSSNRKEASSGDNIFEFEIK